MKKKLVKAFTLLEVIIVVIIVGVLISLALPRFFMMVERSRAMEAIQILGIIRNQMDVCLASGPTTNANIAKCDSLYFSEFTQYFKNSNSHFDYDGTAIGSDPIVGYVLMVTRNTNELASTDPGDSGFDCAPTNNISGTVSSKSRLILCSGLTSVRILGTGLYQGM